MGSVGTVRGNIRTKDIGRRMSGRGFDKAAALKRIQANLSPLQPIKGIEQNDRCEGRTTKRTEPDG